MSGIAKPHANFTTSTTPDVLVNVDFIQNAEKIDIPATPLNNSKPEFMILLTSVLTKSETKINKIHYATMAARDAAFTALKALISTPI
jgi:hypothetical protein